MKTVQKIQRRKFIKLSAMSGAALMVVGYLPFNGKKSLITNLSGFDNDTIKLNAYIIIKGNGEIIIYNHRPEMGQGTFESIPMIIAEELEVDIKKIKIEPSPANRALYGSQMVVGSQSIRGNYDLMRKVGASAKEMLITAAANKWKVDPNECYAQDAMVIHRSSGKKFTYSELASDASKLTPTQNPKLKDPKNFRIIGTSPIRQDLASKTNGEAVFGIDCSVPGMLYASVERSPVFIGKIISIDDSEAKAVKGVKFVLKTQRNVWGHVCEGVAVVADNYWAALKARKLLKVVWDNGDLELWSTDKIWEDYKNASQQDGETFEQRGNVHTALNNAPIKIEATYQEPYQAHASMEPMNGIVYAQKDKCEYWGSTQNPNGVKSQLAKQCGLGEDKVIIHYTYMGGAFGRRGLTDVPEEAADLSMKTGAPIKVLWTREDDITRGPFRACSLNVCRGGLDNNGHPTAMEHKVICQEIMNQTGNSNRAGDMIAGGINTEYAFANMAVKGVLRKLYIPVSFWRSVYHSTNCFAHESFIDEMAVAAKKDPLDFRLSLLKKHERYTAVLKTVAEKSGWYKPREKDTGKGVAIIERSGSYVAIIAEIKKTGSGIKPIKITAAIDSGIAINPDALKAQTQGSIIMGLTAAYKSSITIEKGKAVENNFDTYNMLRINECPEIEVIVMKNNYAPEGAGEAGVPAIAPAITNAIYNATGKRIRTLPFDIDEI